MFSASSRNRLTVHDVGRFAGDTLFDRVARAACRARCLPRKELYETWEMARRVRRLFRGGRVIDLGGGHGLLAHVMLLLDDSSPSAVVIDKALPPSSAKLHTVLLQEWPRLAGRIELLTSALDGFDICATDVVVSSHACGALTDRVLDRAIAANARVAVLPCCHDLKVANERASEPTRAERGSGAIGDARGLSGWMDGPAAIDVMRAVRLTQHGYRVWTQIIPAEITAKNRLLLGAPRPLDVSSKPPSSEDGGWAF
jgi:hypothetical protein